MTSHGAHDVTVHLLAAAPNRSYLEAHGFGLEQRQLRTPDRLTRLLLVMSIALHFAVSTGRSDAAANPAADEKK